MTYYIIMLNLGLFHSKVSDVLHEDFNLIKVDYSIVWPCFLVNLSANKREKTVMFSDLTEGNMQKFRHF